MAKDNYNELYEKWGKLAEKKNDSQAQHYYNSLTKEQQAGVRLLMIARLKSL